MVLNNSYRQATLGGCYSSGLPALESFLHTKLPTHKRPWPTTHRDQHYSSLLTCHVASKRQSRPFRELDRITGAADKWEETWKPPVQTIAIGSSPQPPPTIPASKVHMGWCALYFHPSLSLSLLSHTPDEDMYGRPLMVESERGREREIVQQSDVLR